MHTASGPIVVGPSTVAGPSTAAGSSTVGPSTDSVSKYTKYPAYTRTRDLDDLTHGKTDVEQILYLSDQQQSQLITLLLREDLVRNEFYCKCLWMMTFCSMPFFAIRWCYGNRWESNDLFFLISLGVSFRTVPQPVLLPDKGEIALIYPGKYWLFAQCINVLWTFGMMIWMWTKIFTVGTISQSLMYEEAIATYPFVIGVMNFMMRKFIEAVNFKDLQHLRYKYKDI